jgi:hypothetical protein
VKAFALYFGRLSNLSRSLFVSLRKLTVTSATYSDFSIVNDEQSAISIFSLRRMTVGAV